MSQIPGHHNLLQQLMDNMPDNIFFKDRDSKFIMINEADAKWLGFKHPEELVGKSDFDLFTEEFAEMAHEDEKRVMETGEPMTCKEEKAVWPDGHATWVSTSKIPLRDEQGEIVGCIGIGRDITDIKQKEFELQEANERLNQANRQIADDLRMAAKLQQTFLPQSYPSFVSDNGQACLDFYHYYQADIELGGDFCSIYKLSDTQAGLLICDVMGHGVRAALITGIIRTIGEDLAKKTDDPGQFLTEMNRHLFPLLRSDDAYLFATACYLTIDIKTGLLEGAIAGHPRPFIIDQQRGSVSEIEIEEDVAGPALAIMQDQVYRTFSEQMSPSDSVLMYTDGLCEAMNCDCDEFGTAHLQELMDAYIHLPLKELVQCMIQTVGRFTGGDKFGDDICLLGFTLVDPAKPIKLE